jgi:4-diphosphocytidyl-2-C-methyl-D-erythritol kinase
MISELKNQSINDIGLNLCNVFEEVIDLNSVTNIKKVMFDYGAAGAAMSGSGPSVFGLFDDEKKAKNCFKKLNEAYKQVFLCHPSNFGVKIL